VKLTTHLRLVPNVRIVELYLHSPICLYGNIFFNVSHVDLDATTGGTLCFLCLQFWVGLDRPNKAGDILWPLVNFLMRLEIIQRAERRSSYDLQRTAQPNENRIC
jgi:hypothetical protein